MTTLSQISFCRNRRVLFECVIQVNTMNVQILWCYVMLCYAMLCYVMLCYVMLCYVMSCHVMSCHVMSCHVMSCHVMSCYVMLCYVMLVLCYVMLLIHLAWRTDEATWVPGRRSHLSRGCCHFILRWLILSKDPVYDKSSWPPCYNMCTIPIHLKWIYIVTTVMTMFQWLRYQFLGKNV